MSISDPRSISGLKLWCSAKAVTGLADNADLSTWDDLSGLNNHLIASATKPKWRSAGSAYAGSPITIQFNANTQLALPTNLLSGATAAEVLFIVRSNGTGHSLHTFGSNSGQHEHYQWGDGNVYEPCFSTSRFQFVPTMSISSTMRRYNIYSAAGSWRAFLDGTAQIAEQGGSFSAPASMVLGNGYTNFNGWISGIIIYNRKLTTSERADLEAWVASNMDGGLQSAPTAAPNAPTSLVATPSSKRMTLTWAAGASDPTNTATSFEYRVNGGSVVDIGSVLTYAFSGLSPSTSYTYEVRAKNVIGVSSWTSVTQSTTADIGNPKGVPNLWSWLSTDAIPPQADDTSFTGAWQDQSGLGHHATRSGTAPKYRTSLGRLGGPTLRFASNGFYNITPPTGTSAGEIFVVTKPASGAQTSPFGNGPGWPQFCYYPYNSANQQVRMAWNRSARFDFGAPVHDIYLWRRVNVWSAANDYAVLTDEQQIGGSPLVSSTFQQNGIAIGYDEASSDGPSQFNGDISCVLIFTRKLTAVERADVTDWLIEHPSGGVLGGNIKLWNGSAWVTKPAKVWNGSAWVTKPVKRWNGSSWVLTSS